MKNLFLLVMAVMLFVITGCSTLCKENSVCGKIKKENALKIGWASTDISTKEPVFITGQFHVRISSGILDPITATALWIDNGKESVCFVSADLISVGSGLLDEVSSVVKKCNPAVPVDKIILNATHTHTSANYGRKSPVCKGDHTSADPYIAPTSIKTYPSPAYRKFLVSKLAHIICKAYENRKEGGFAYGYGFATVGHNRRAVYKDDTSKRPGAAKNSTNNVHGYARMYGSSYDKMFYGYEGGNDAFVNILFTFDKNKKLTGAIINIPCPSQNSESLWKISASFWNEARENIRKKYGNIFILPQSGAAGDLSPRQLHYLKAERRRHALKYERKEAYREEFRRKEIGERIAKAFDDVYFWAKKDIIESAQIRHEIKILSLPPRHISKADYDDAVKSLAELNKKSFVPEGNDPQKALRVNSILVSGRNRYRGIITRWKNQQKNEPFKTQTHVLHIGDVAFASNQFELYQDYMHRIQGRSQFIQTFVIQLAGVSGEGGGSYLATKRSVENRGYGSDRFSNRVSWKGGDMLVDETVKILDRFYEAQNSERKKSTEKK